MDKERQLPKTDGSCWAESSPSTAGTESNQTVALLKQIMAVVAMRGDLDYAQDVAHDMLLALLQCGYGEEAACISKLELTLRQQQLNEKTKQQRQFPEKLADQLNLLTGSAAQALLEKDKKEGQ